MKKKVYAFDFDGTLTRRDTFVEFIRFARGTGRFLFGFALYSPLLVLMKMRLFPNWRAKQLVFSHFFKGMSIADFDGLCQRFAREKRSILRPKGMQKIREAISEGSQVMIISASIDNWVRPFFADFGDLVKVSCTRIDVRNDRVTGKFLTKHCYGREKVKRIDRAFPHRTVYELIAFGDSQGDKAMLDYADQRFYKPFR